MIYLLLKRKEKGNDTNIPVKKVLCGSRRRGILIMVLIYIAIGQNKMHKKVAQ